MGLTSDLRSAPAPQPARPGRNHEGRAGWFRWYHAVIAVVALVLLALVLFVTIQPIQVLPRMTLAPGYSFVDATGARHTSEDQRGRITLYTITWTGCEPPACTPSGDALAAIQNRLRSVETDGVPVDLLTISFNPEHDTPEALRAWLDDHGADPAVWSAMTGDPARLKNVIGGGFGVYYTQDEAGEWYVEPASILVDGNGIIRTRYRTATPDPEIVARDVGLVTREVANSTGAQKLAYEAAHLFLCYPD